MSCTEGKMKRRHALFVVLLLVGQNGDCHKSAHFGGQGYGRSDFFV
jgi:hypothetical protein